MGSSSGKQKINKEDASPTNPQDDYQSWMVARPSAIASFECMMKASKGKKIAVFLDYDETLSPIVTDPNRAFMSDEMRATVRELAKYFPTAIISGRSREKVQEFVQASNVNYAGSHGMDIMVQKTGLPHHDDPPPPYRDMETGSPA